MTMQSAPIESSVSLEGGAIQTPLAPGITSAVITAATGYLRHSVQDTATMIHLCALENQCVSSYWCVSSVFTYRSDILCVLTFHGG